MTAGELRTHIRYSGWASRKLLDAGLELDQERLFRPMGVSHRSIGDTLAHIHSAERIWFSRVVDPAIPIRPPADLPAVQALQTMWLQIQERWEKWADSLSDSGVARVVSYSTTGGQHFETEVWQIVLHMVNHATLHRGQVMAMMRQLGVPPPSTDLIFYYREQP